MANAHSVVAEASESAQVSSGQQKPQRDNHHETLANLKIGRAACHTRKFMGFYEHNILPLLVNLAMRDSRLVPYRRRVLSLAEGGILEIGVGSGSNLPFYADSASEVLGIDPHP